MNDTPRRIVFLTGMSGAGKSTALKVFEDLGFEAVDNLPQALLSNLVMSGSDGHSVAIGIDVRSRDFSAEALLAEIERLRTSPGTEVTVVFLECEDSELENRFKTTRRRHPLAHDRRVMDGIAQERELIRPLKQRADMVVDTTERTVTEFRHLMDDSFASGKTPGLTLFITSFSFAHGVPREADLVFDVRFLNNPHYDDDLRDLSGLNASVGAHIVRDPDFSGFMDNLQKLLEPLLPRYTEEGKRYLTIAIGCTGGRHRSVFVAEELSKWLKAHGHTLGIVHRDLVHKGLENVRK